MSKSIQIKAGTTRQETALTVALRLPLIIDYFHKRLIHYNRLIVAALVEADDYLAATAQLQPL